MDEGAFLLADCLGFRGIWKRVDPQQLINKLLSMEAEVAAAVVPKYAATNLSFGPVRFHHRLLSDTVALSAQYESNPEEVPNEVQVNLLVSMACESASVLARLFMDEEMPNNIKRTRCLCRLEHLFGQWCASCFTFPLNSRLAKGART
jgi:hypothetical protein